jgi:hypothetical protein
MTKDAQDDEVARAGVKRAGVRPEAESTPRPRCTMNVMSFSRTVRALAVVAMLPHGCRPFEAATSSADAGEDAGTALDGGSDALLDAGSDAPVVTGRPPPCKVLLERDAALDGDGVYTDPNDPDGSAPLQVFCDFTLDDGGWTLVGRSAKDAGTPSPFGWTSATGSVTDESAPYSLDVAAAKLSFREVLVANRERTIAYKFTVPDNFVTEYADAAVRVGQLTKVRGNCPEEQDTPWMLQHAGWTAATEGFFFRDNDRLDAFFGLMPDGLDLNYRDDCQKAGKLHGQQGAIFVR